MKIQLAAKFEKNLMDGYPALVRTDRWKNGTDNYSPFPTKVGGLIQWIFIGIWNIGTDARMHRRAKVKFQLMSGKQQCG